MIDQVESNIVDTVIQSQESGDHLKSAAKLKYNNLATKITLIGGAVGAVIGSIGGIIGSGFLGAAGASVGAGVGRVIEKRVEKDVDKL